MTDTDAHTRVVDSYFDAGNEIDAAARETLLPAMFTTDGRDVDPQSGVTGAEGIAAMMARVHEQYPGITVRRTSRSDAHHDVLRFPWEILGGDGSVAVDGVDVCHADPEGKLRDVRGSFETTVPA